MSITTLSSADQAAHAAASYIRPARTVLAEFPAGHPRGSWPAEEFADQLGRPVDVVMDLDGDKYLVVVPAVSS